MKTRLRVLYVTSTFARTADDSEDPWQGELARRLARQVDLTVLAPAWRGGRDHDWQGIPVHRFRYLPAVMETLTHGAGASVNSRTLAGKLAAVPYLLAGHTALQRELLARPYDVLHLHWPVPHALWLWPYLPAAPRVVLHWYGVEMPLARRLPGGMALLRAALRRADANIAISRHTADALVPFAPQPLAVIPYGITCGTPLPRPVQPANTILFVGRLVARKGVDVLLRAFAIFCQSVSGWKLVIIGDGPQRGKLEMIARGLDMDEDIVFRGRVSHDELRAAYAAATLFALPAVSDTAGETEGLGVVLLEALHNRVPVVASRIGGITDVITDDGTGALVPPGDAAALAAALVALARDPARAARLADDGAALLRGPFAWEHITAAMLAAYGAGHA
ncbi:MAG TPA: glycosyltransferase family 4 protein [bacterium]|nr:glycosyltransferase family 4 protein [bacterium]